MEKLIGEQREIIEGKPYFGIWCANYVVISVIPSAKWPEDPYFIEVIARLKNSVTKEFEIRQESLIYRPHYVDFLSFNSTVGIKYIMWGRAFKVMRALKKGSKTYKKVYVGGKRKRVRVL